MKDDDIPTEIITTLGQAFIPDHEVIKSYGETLKTMVDLAGHAEWNEEVLEGTRHKQRIAMIEKLFDLEVIMALTETLKIYSEQMAESNRDKLKKDNINTVVDLKEKK